MVLDKAKCARLMGLMRHEGYQDLLDLGNYLCEAHVTELMKVDGSEHDKVIDRHKGARYARLLFDDLCLEVEKAAKSILTPEKTKPLPEDFIKEEKDAIPAELPADYIPEVHAALFEKLKK